VDAQNVADAQTLRTHKRRGRTNVDFKDIRTNVDFTLSRTYVVFLALCHTYVVFLALSRTNVDPNVGLH
jgi:hypothetical protein